MSTSLPERRLAFAMKVAKRWANEKTADELKALKRIGYKVQQRDPNALIEFTASQALNGKEDPSYFTHFD